MCILVDLYVDIRRCAKRQRHLQRLYWAEIVECYNYKLLLVLMQTKVVGYNSHYCNAVDIRRTLWWGWLPFHAYQSTLRKTNNNQDRIHPKKYRQLHDTNHVQGPTPQTSSPTQSKDSMPPGPNVRWPSLVQRTMLLNVGQGAVVPEIREEDMYSP